MKKSISCLLALVAGTAAYGEQLRNLSEIPPKAGRIAVPSDREWPARAGEAGVCLWEDDKIAAFSITIDDNCRPDHEWWLKLSDELGFKLTWFIITDSVGGPNAGFNGTWDDWRKIVAAGHSVQSHTTNHNSAKTAGRELADEELERMYGDSLKVIAENLPGNRACCIAYPRGEVHRNIAAKYAIAARGTSGVPDAAGRIDYLCTNAGGGEATAELVANGQTEKGQKWLRGKTHFKRGWVVALYHLVHHGHTPEAQAKSAAKAEAEIRAIAALKDRLWIGRFEDVARYGQERDTAELKVVENASGRISFELSDRMDDALFDYPLSVKIRLPDDWQGVSAAQGDGKADATIVRHEGKPFAIVRAIPDRGTVTVKKQEASR
jgi:hypothetical protein